MIVEWFFGIFDGFRLIILFKASFLLLSSLLELFHVDEFSF
jgi:hypothetical protein